MAVCAGGLHFSASYCRWLMMKGRSQEALQVLSRINRHRKSETTVDTFLELEELRTAVKAMASSENKMWFTLKELYRYKYR